MSRKPAGGGRGNQPRKVDETFSAPDRPVTPKELPKEPKKSEPEKKK